MPTLDCALLATSRAAELQRPNCARDTPAAACRCCVDSELLLLFLADLAYGRCMDQTMKYTVEFCDREYNARLAIPDHPQIFARRAEQAAATRRLRPACSICPMANRRRKNSICFRPAQRLRRCSFSFTAAIGARSTSRTLLDRAAAREPRHHGGAAELWPRTEDTDRRDRAQVLRSLAWLYRNAQRYDNRSRANLRCRPLSGWPSDGE